MKRLRTGWFVTAAVGAMLCCVVVMMIGCGGGSGPAVGPVGEGLTGYEDPSRAADDVFVRLGGFRFKWNSHRIDHPYFKATPTTPNWRMVGYGSMKGTSKTVRFSYGGKVKGVKTLLLYHVGRGSPWAWTEKFWVAQDATGNVHYLKYRILRDENGDTHPAELLGVAGRNPPLFMLPRQQDITVGRTWYGEKGGRKLVRFRITSTNATAKGMGGLLRIQMVFDTNGDGRFNSRWNGPDDRDDSFYRPNLGWHVWMWNVAPPGGFVRGP